MPIRELFVSDITRDIPPVVYFHEQSPEKLAVEVAEYIITGGYPPDSTHHRRVPDGIHEQYVKVLTAITSEIKKPGGPELPNVWISGFYGSGKSSFAKLLGLALDGVALPSGKSLAEAWLARDRSPLAKELEEAWSALIALIHPISVVFDIGGTARDNEHIHAAAVRHVQKRLGYCPKDLVADFELKLERDGEYARFEKLAADVLGAPWAEKKTSSMADDDFSLVMHEMFPKKFVEPTSWFDSRAGIPVGAASPDEAVRAIDDMLKFRKPGATLFLVVDEVSQYVLSSHDRVERLRAFAEKLGARLKGKAWLLALGQQKLDEDADASFLVKTKDRFPPKLRVHLAATNIRDVVHQRLLAKKPAAQSQLRELFLKHRNDLKLFAYGCDTATPDDFVETYPMLPGHIDLMLQITSALRIRSTRSQGDDQAIRGLLQLLGELFRDQKLADADIGTLVTLDQIYEVQHTALESDVQASMARILDHCAADSSGLQVRVAKVVALLELIQETLPTTAELVARCLYDRVDRGNQVQAVTDALEALRNDNLLSLSEKTGYKLQSSAAEEWGRERKDIGVARQIIGEVVRDGLKHLLAAPKLPELEGRPFPWAGVFSDGQSATDVVLVDPRSTAPLRVDFRFVSSDERAESTWIKRSAETALENRLVWVVGNSEAVDDLARELARSRAMVRKYKPRRESLTGPRKELLSSEESRTEELEAKAREAISAAWMTGKMYFRGRPITPSEHGAAFATAVTAVGNRILPDMFPHFVATQVHPSEVMQLLEKELVGPPPKFLDEELGILEQDAGRYVPACSGVVARRVQEHIDSSGGLGGQVLLAHFGGPPFGYTPDVVKACVAGLLRAGKVRIQPDSGKEITGYTDAGVREVFEKDRAFKRADFFPAGEDDIGPHTRAKICKFLEDELKEALERNDTAIANAVSTHFPVLAKRLRDVLARHRQIPGAVDPPPALVPLDRALEKCVASARQTKPTVKLVKKHLDELRDGIQLLQRMDSDLTPEVIQEVRDANAVSDHHVAQLREVGALAGELETLAEALSEHLRSERPWRGIEGFRDHVSQLRDEYQRQRQAALEQQSEACDLARSAVKTRKGFSTLTGDQSHHVLRPIAEAMTSTSPEAIVPTLASLKDPFLVALERASKLANERLDEILSEGDKPVIRRVALDLRNREVSSPDDVKALLDEIEKRLLAALEDGARVRLV